MITRVIEVQGLENEERPTLGMRDLNTRVYPEGTTRVVRQYNILPKKLEGERTGWFNRPYILQRARIVAVASLDGEAMDVNVWEDVKFVNRRYEK